MERLEQNQKLSFEEVVDRLLFIGSELRDNQDLSPYEAMDLEKAERLLPIVLKAFEDLQNLNNSLDKQDAFPKENQMRINESLLIKYVFLHKRLHALTPYLALRK